MNIKYTNEELKGIMFSAADYPLEFPDTIGLGYRDSNYHTELRIQHPDGTRHVTLAVESFGNEFYPARHVYGRLVVDGVVLRPNECDDDVKVKYSGIQPNALLAAEYVFLLHRQLTPDEMKEQDRWGYLRWHGYKHGEYVTPFRNKDELVNLTKQVFRQCFHGLWSLWMEDSTGPGVTRTLLMSGKK